MKTILVTQNYGGNLHATAATINREALSDYLLSLHSVSGHATIVVFRIPFSEQIGEPSKVKEMRAGAAL
jgi:hypothetical protein